MVDWCVVVTPHWANSQMLFIGLQEWVWPLAYFLRAKLYFASKLEKHRKGILRETAEFVDSVLCRHYQELMNSPWKSLPELTNTNGSVSSIVIMYTIMMLSYSTRILSL